MSGSGYWDEEAGFGIVSAQIVCRSWYDSCVEVGYHFDTLVGLAAALIVGIRADCAVAAICDFVEARIRACGGLISKEKRRGDRREFRNGGESETDLVR